jgi:hypothetical protein
MTFPEHNRFVVRGQFGTTKEIWSNVLHFTSSQTFPTQDVHPQSDWDGSAITSAVNAFYGSSLFSANVRTTGWRGYTIGANGRFTDQNILVNDYDTPNSAGGTNRYPPQVALALTLTADNRGPARLGRVFLPSVSTGFDGPTCEISSGGADDLLAAFKTYVEALKDAMYPLAASGESLLNVSKIGTGTLQKVTSYRCGLVLDTIRTRRNKLVENYRELGA